MTDERSSRYAQPSISNGRPRLGNCRLIIGTNLVFQSAFIVGVHPVAKSTSLYGNATLKVQRFRLMIAGKLISSRGRVLSIISFGLGMSSMANRDRVPGIHSGLPKKIFMPTPSKGIKLAYEGCETTLTLVGFSKRFLAERTRNPSLTAQAFAASPSPWARKRLAVIPTELEIGGKRIALTRISKLLGELKGTGTRYLNALKAFA
ncbi:hypothetical protein P0D69_21740, partial [Paraburkholderia sediminicola]|uniref:hypothetical protein n=1 Tax=Paraburkholderia sediminicola TaxID=458836 RepID=UPI0038BCB002